MGIWGKVFGSVMDAYPGAYNAVLAEHALSVMAAQDRAEVLAGVIPLVMDGSPGMTISMAESIFSKAGRPAQLNFVALVMASFQMVPRLPKELWFSITNPFVSCPESPAFREKISQISGQMYKKHGLEIQVSRRPLDLGVGGVLHKHATEEDLQAFTLKFLKENPHYLNPEWVAKADALYFRLKDTDGIKHLPLAAVVEFVFQKGSGEIQ